MKWDCLCTLTIESLTEVALQVVLQSMRCSVPVLYMIRKTHIVMEFVVV